MNGLFITFEGPDGSGKSTQIRYLASHLQSEGIPYILTREPGGTTIGDQIRTLLLDPAYKEMANETEALLYAASRAQHVQEKIKPALTAGNVVLCDRFVDASIAYQGYGLGLDVAQVKRINAFATGGLVPDRSYFLDLSAQTGKDRMQHRRHEKQTEADRIEQKQLTYHEQVRQAFQLLFSQNQERICALDGEENKDQLFAQIKDDFASIWSQFQSKGEV